MNDNLMQQLTELYKETSKHSNYQVLVPSLSDLLNTQTFQIKSRHEIERWQYISKNIDFVDKTVADIGGNTGFFCFSALDAGAYSVDYYEGNASHAKFVELSAQMLQHQNQVRITNNYIDFEENNLQKKVDILLLLNVLHHIGDDYGDGVFNSNQALEYIAFALKKLSYQTEYLVFQLGFNWKGNINQPLFANGTKSEAINFIKKSIRENWIIKNIGIAVHHKNSITYKELDDNNIQRFDELGEFLNRPIFILKSLWFSA